MRKALFAAVVALAAVATPAKAWDWPTTTTATFPLLTPSGYYSNTYYYAWAYPWFAYYNYAHGPYANWWWYGGYATYGHPVYGYGWPGYFTGPLHGYGYGWQAPVAPFVGTAAGTLVVTLPENATLKFNGVAATGTGAERSFTLPSLSYGQDYGYDLTAEVTADGKTAKATAKVVVRAGETARVTIAVE